MTNIFGRCDKKCITKNIRISSKSTPIHGLGSWKLARIVEKSVLYPMEWVRRVEKVKKTKFEGVCKLPSSWPLARVERG